MSLNVKVMEATLAKTSTNKDYIRGKFYDGEITLPGIHWDWPSGKAFPEVGEVIRIEALKSVYNGNDQLTIRKYLGKVTDKEELKRFRITAPQRLNIEAEYDDLIALITSIENKTLRKMVLSIFTNDKAFEERILSTPAAKGIHHAYPGGFIVHTSAVAHLAFNIAQIYSNINYDLVIAGAALHDIGKVFAYYTDIEGKPDMTPEGKLLDHVYIGAKFVSGYYHSFFEEAGTDDNFDAIMVLLEHIILSHHGKLEYGSPVTPKCLEAMVVHMADNIDAKQEHVQEYLDTFKNDVWFTEKMWLWGNQELVNPAKIEHLLEGIKAPLDE